MHGADGDPRRDLLQRQALVERRAEDLRAVHSHLRLQVELDAVPHRQRLVGRQLLPGSQGEAAVAGTLQRELPVAQRCAKNLVFVQFLEELSGLLDAFQERVTVHA